MTAASTPDGRSAGTTSASRDRDFADVLRRAQHGDGAAFESLYRWLAPQVTSYAVSRGADDAEGITNETFLAVFKRIGDFDGSDAAFRSWVFTITRHRIIDAHRARSRRPQLSDRPVPEVAVEGADRPALDALGSQRVVSLLETLSEEQRDVILLRMVGDLSLKQVAAIMDKPVSAVKALQRRGLRRLQAEILAEAEVVAR